MAVPLMDQQEMRKSVHFSSALWFMLCAAFIFVSAMRQAGRSWWFVFTFSGHSALIAFLLLNLYLFAIYRGVSRNQKGEVEHPLTTSTYYMIFYSVSPFLGALAGGLGSIGFASVSHFLLMIAIGSFWTTGLVWVIIDPIAGLLEMQLPASRRHRRKRLETARILKMKENIARQQLLSEIEAKDNLELINWQRTLKPYAERLVALLAIDATAQINRQAEAVDIGVSAWQMGGLDCMKLLHTMAMELSEQEHPNSTITDYISIWWDGVGSWRNEWFPQQVAQL